MATKKSNTSGLVSIQISIDSPEVGKNNNVDDLRDFNDVGVPEPCQLHYHTQVNGRL